MNWVFFVLKFSVPILIHSRFQNFHYTKETNFYYFRAIIKNNFTFNSITADSNVFKILLMKTMQNWCLILMISVCKPIDSAISSLSYSLLAGAKVFDNRSVIIINYISYMQVFPSLLAQKTPHCLNLVVLWHASRFKKHFS